MSSWPDTSSRLMQRLANASDAEAWAEFERCYQAAIYRFARNRGLQPSDAKDVVQEVMLAVHRQASTWESTGRKGAFRAWLSETARRVSLDQIKRRFRAGENGTAVMQRLSEVADSGTNPDEQRDHERWQFYFAAAELEAAVNPLHWKAFWLTAVAGIAADEVGRQLEMSVGAIYSARCRIPAKLRRVIQTLRHAERSER